MEAELLSKINADAALLSLLYDLDLMPEQVLGNAKGEQQMRLVVGVFFAGREAERGGQ